MKINAIMTLLRAKLIIMLARDKLLAQAEERVGSFIISEVIIENPKTGACKSIKAVIDTGCNTTTLQKHLFKELGFESTGICSCVGANNHITLNNVSNAKLHINNKSGIFEITFQDHHINLIGINEIRALKLNVDTRNMCLKDWVE